jgi:parvulin-like peptidyl-prolyl isomerase
MSDAPPADLEGEREEVPLEFVLRHARLTEQLGFVRSAARAFLVSREARRRSIAPTDGAVQAAADAFRRARGLLTSRETEAWLCRHGITLEEFEERIRGEVLEHLVREAVTADRVRGYFSGARTEFETAVVWRIRHRDKGVILEIQVIEADSEHDFQALARQCSEDGEIAARGGYLGTVPLSSLPLALHDRIRASKPGDVLGPIEHNGAWELYQVSNYRPAVFDASAREQAAGVLFERWIEAALARLRIPLIEGPH